MSTAAYLPEMPEMCKGMRKCNCCFRPTHSPVDDGRAAAAQVAQDVQQLECDAGDLHLTTRQARLSAWQQSPQTSL